MIRAFLSALVFVSGCAAEPWDFGRVRAEEVAWRGALGMEQPLVPVTWFRGCNGKVDPFGGRAVAEFPGLCVSSTIVGGESILVEWTDSYAGSDYAPALWREGVFEMTGEFPQADDVEKIAVVRAALEEEGL